MEIERTAREAEEKIRGVDLRAGYVEIFHEEVSGHGAAEVRAKRAAVAQKHVVECWSAVAAPGGCMEHRRCRAYTLNRFRPTGVLKLRPPSWLQQRGAC